MRAFRAATCALLLVSLVGAGCAARDASPKPVGYRRPDPFSAFVTGTRSVVVVGDEAWGTVTPQDGDFLALDGTPVALRGRGPGDATVMIPDVVRGIRMMHVVPIRYRPGGPKAGSSGKLWETYTVQYRSSALWLQRVDGVTDDTKVGPYFGPGTGVWEPVTPHGGDLVWLSYDKSLAATLTGKLASWDPGSGTARLVAPGAIGSVPILDFVDIHVGAGLKLEPLSTSRLTASSKKWTTWTGSVGPDGRVTATGVRLLDGADQPPGGSTVASMAPAAGDSWIDGLSSGAIDRRAATILGEPPSPGDDGPTFSVPGDRFLTWQ